MFKKKKRLPDLMNDYKKNLNQWKIIRKRSAFNIIEYERKYFLILAPAPKGDIIPCDEVTVMYEVTEELYNKIQEGDIIELIVKKEEEKNGN